MSERVDALLVALERPIPEDEAMALMTAIGHMRGVLRVERAAQVECAHEWVARLRAYQMLHKALWEQTFGEKRGERAVTRGKLHRVRQLVWRGRALVHRLVRSYVEYVLDEIAIERSEVGRDCTVCVYRGRCLVEPVPLCHVPAGCVVVPQDPRTRGSSPLN